MPKRVLHKPKLLGLDKPIELPDLVIPQHLIDSFPSEEFWGWFEDYPAQQDEYIKTERMKKFDTLIRYYGLPPDTLTNHKNNHAALLELCKRMAHDFVDGFILVQPKKKGRSTKWHELILYILWFEVEQRPVSKKYNACRTLAKQEPWRKLLNVKYPDKADYDARCAGALYEQYELAKNSIVVKNLQKKYGAYNKSGKFAHLFREKYEFLKKLHNATPDESRTLLKQWLDQRKLRKNLPIN